MQHREHAKGDAKILETVDVAGNGKLIKKIIKQGAGPFPPADGSHSMIMHYTGRLENGNVFDSSVSRGKPFEFTLGAREVILGWDIGVATMKKGEKVILQCSPEYAYGDSGAGSVIPPKATLHFEVELINWKKRESNAMGNLFLALIVAFVVYFFVFKK